MHTSKIKKRSYRVLTPGKLIFIGEYAVLSGAPAIVSAVSTYAVAEISDSDKAYSTFCPTNFTGDGFKFHHRKGQIEIPQDNNSRKYPFIIEVLKQFNNHQLPEKTAFQLQVDTSDFYSGDGTKYGLGSSAAATVAAASAVNIYLDLNLTRVALFQLVQAAHQKAQKQIGSGIDLAASIFGGIRIYSIDADNNEPALVSMPSDLHWLAIWSGKSASTVSLVRQLNVWRKKNTSEYDRLINTMSHLSELSCELMLNGNSPGFCEAIVQYESILSELSEKSKVPIVSKDHEQIKMLVKKAGGVYKPSGAGSGDFGIAFFLNHENLRETEKLLQTTPYRRINLDLDRFGAHLN